MLGGARRRWGSKGDMAERVVGDADASAQMLVTRLVVDPCFLELLFEDTG